MRYRITIEVETGMPRKQFNAEVKQAIDDTNWPVVYLATEIAEDNEYNTLLNRK